MMIDSAAPVVLTTEVFVEAPVNVAWDLLVDVQGWPTWHPGIRSVVADRPPGPGMEFRWRPGPYRIDSAVQEFEPRKRIGWTGRSPGVAARHVWTLRADGDGVVVRTEESLTGLLPRLLRRRLQVSVRTDLDEWLGHLKTEAERRVPTGGRTATEHGD
jgi:uncharacterized protein YndB with AHSA1/START domain